jgi:hypothetical protein
MFYKVEMYGRPDEVIQQSNLVGFRSSVGRN